MGPEGTDAIQIILDDNLISPILQNLDENLAELKKILNEIQF